MGGPELTTLIESLLGLATCLLLIGVSIPTRRPWSVVITTFRRTLPAWRRWLYLAIGLAIIFANYVYLLSGVDRYFTDRIIAWRGEDFTQSFCRVLEGDAVARVQAALAWGPLTWFLTWAYVVVFPCLVMVAIPVFDHFGNRRGLALVLLGYLFNYLLVLPFYVVFPIRECHAFYSDAAAAGLPAAAHVARLLLNDVSPTIMESYRTMSGVDNCFPSFHTSLALTMALVAWHDGRRFGAIFTFLGLSIVAATIYLGIHWFTDIAAGVATALVAYALALRVTRRWGGASSEHQGPREIQSPIPNTQSSTPK